MPYYMSYEERRQLRAQQLDEFKRLIRDDFPTGYVVVHSIVLTALSLALIAIQVVLLVNGAFLSAVANGIWCAFFNFIAILTALVFIKKRTWGMMIVTMVGHIVSYLASLFCALIYIFPIILAQRRSDVLLGWDIAGLVVGFVATIFAITFFIYIPCRYSCRMW